MITCVVFKMVIYLRNLNIKSYHNDKGVTQFHVTIFIGVFIR